MIIHKKATFFTAKGVILAIAGIIVVIALIIGGWSLAATSAERTFSDALEQSKTAIAQQLSRTIPNIKAVTAKNDPVKTADFLSQFATSVDDAIDALPKPETILGVPLVGAVRQDQADIIKSKLRDLNVALRASSDLLRYEQNVVAPLLKVTNLHGKDSTEQAKLADNWQTLLQQLQNISPPTTVAEVHSAIIDLVTKIQQALTALPPLMDAKDTPAVAAKLQELDTEVAKLQNLSGIFHNLDTDSDKTFSDTYKAAQEVVQ